VRFRKLAYGIRLKIMPAAKNDGKNGGKSCDRLRKERLKYPMQETVIGDMTGNLR